MTRLPICVVLASLLTACGSGTPVAFHNTSAHRLDGVVLSGNGFEASLGVVAPGQSLKAQVHPSGESGLAIRFTTNGRNYRYEPQDYFEGGGRYAVSATVNHDLTVAVRSETRL